MSADGSSHPPSVSVNRALPHDSAARHVAGTAVYVDDIVEPTGLLHVQFGGSAHAHARITGLDLSAVAAMPGVVAVLTAADIPGRNDVSPVAGDDPLFADGLVEHVGQPIFAVVACTYQEARLAVRKALVHYDPLPAVLSIAEAMQQKSFISEPYEMKRGDVARALARASNRLAGRVIVGGQEHFYLEGQAAMAVPGEDGEITVMSSTQHPTEIQHVVGRVLGLPNARVVVETRRMGGGFGGKESQASFVAAAAALAARITGRPAKLRLDRDDDMAMTGKRHDFVIDYDVGFDQDGRIQGIDFSFASRCGRSADLSDAINDRAMFHADNAYFLENVRIRSYRCKTHTVSNTAFRGFGGPQGMAAIERVIEDIAVHLGRDALDVRKANLYGTTDRNVTPYYMTVEDNILHGLIDDLERSGEYRRRRAAVAAFNASNAVLKKGLALTPVKFGISFTTTHLNQAGALVHVYADGSVHLNHGGTEMGQGLNIKVAQVVAEVFAIDVDRIRITATSTDKVPNTSATAASSGSDMNGMAAQAAARTIRQRLRDFAAATAGVPPDHVSWIAEGITAGDRHWTFEALVKDAHMARISLSSTGFYRTPKINWNRKAARGRPFFYFAYGAAVSEAVIDTLTGENRILRVDILHDVGRSLNPAIDLGQVEGGFIQGMGWLTTEELWFDAAGRLRTHAPSTYKIPACSDRPPVFNMRLVDGMPNREETIHRSKAVGEPPLMLALSAWLALADAVASVGAHRVAPNLDAPATPERILAAVCDVRRRAAAPAQRAAE
ncbi:MAG: xanthine dehydrogenase molybdopterin binding subunit [Alphaproteobacteria bacterium]